jgi:hypothetical protein
MPSPHSWLATTTRHSYIPASRHLRRRYLFLFGGSDSAGECCNDLYVLNVDRREWSIPEMMMGTKPAAREGHVRPFCSLVLRLSLAEWRTRSLCSLPGFPILVSTHLRAGVSKSDAAFPTFQVACMIGRFLIISGGYNDHGRLFDAHVLDTESMVWEALDTSLNQVGVQPFTLTLPNG